MFLLSRKPLRNPIYKCCDWGSQVANSSLNTCDERKNGSSPWYLHINGHRYSEEELKAEGLLKYDPKMVGTTHMHT